MDAETLAKRFHELYEYLAPSFGYKTREASAKPWSEVPENNRKLMTTVCEHILKEIDAMAAQRADAPVPASVTDAGLNPQAVRRAGELGVSEGITTSIPETGVPDAPVQAGTRDANQITFELFRRKAVPVNVAHEIVLKIVEYTLRSAGPAASDGAGLRTLMQKWRTYGANADKEPGIDGIDYRACAADLECWLAARAALPSGEGKP
jgi:hypothetical protein